MGEVEGLPVLDGFWVDFAGDFVPGLDRCGLVRVVVSIRGLGLGSYLKGVAVQALSAEDGVPDAVLVSGHTFCNLVGEPFNLLPLQSGSRRGAKGELPVVLLRDSSKDHFSLVLERANRTNGRSVRTVVGVGTVVQSNVLVAAEVQ